MELADYLMSKSLYIGVRVEISNRFINSELIRQYNKTHNDTKISDFHINGRIAIERHDCMIIAKGADLGKDISNNMANFFMMSKISGGLVAVKRVVQIINVLGNDRLIRERVRTFIGGNSALNNLPELNNLYIAFNDLNDMMPGFIRAGWYYAPEAVLK